MKAALSRKIELAESDYLDQIPTPRFVNRIDLTNFPSPDKLASPDELGTPIVSSVAPESTLAKVQPSIPVVAGLGVLVGFLFGFIVGKQR